MSEFSISLNGNVINLKLSENGSLTVNDSGYPYEIIHLIKQEYILKLGDRFYEIHFNQINSENYHITINGKLYDLTVRTALQERAAKLIERSVVKSTVTNIKAPMPGMVLKVKKTVSDTIQQGESLLILEAMKMENDLKSPVSGKIKNIYVNEGMPVEKGTLLISIE